MTFREDIIFAEGEFAKLKTQLFQMGHQLESLAVGELPPSVQYLFASAKNMAHSQEAIKSLNSSNTDFPSPRSGI